MRENQIIRQWIEQGRPIPPPNELKQRVVKAYGTAFAIRTLIETGTYLGTMVAATKDHFAQIISIELGQQLYQQAKAVFAPYRHITLVHGDSGEVLPDILRPITERCLFWLDGHYSGGITAKGKESTPILKELDHILNHPVRDHVILIDDARLFVGQDDYPPLEALKQYLLGRRPGWTFLVADDIIRFHAK